jgi:hypothetical protein
VDYAMKYVFIVAIALALFLVIGQFVLRYLYSYEVRASEIRILLFSLIPIVRIPMSNVAEVTSPAPRPYWLSPWYALRLGNRIFGEAVLIRKRRGLIKSIIIAPDDPARFIEQCKGAKQEN